MSSMFFQCFTVNENIIQVYLTEFMQTVEQHIIDIVLKESKFMLRSCLDHSIKEAQDWYVCIAL